ncbi:hypothetical protein [Mesorhizobium sp. M0207]|uniref:hypothetical protein n=1 Tax=unclassified Mesorhizobium TaxID=325217 RepID=UPI0033388498
MSEDLSKYSTEELIALARGVAENDDALSYKATGQAIRRWRNGEELEVLVKLLESERSNDRILGSYYLNEVSKKFHVLKTAATELANDTLSACRRAFVVYMTTSGYYDEEVAQPLAKCLLDLDLYVRVATIEWAIRSPQKVFQDFAKRVESGAGGLKPEFSDPLSNEFWNNSSQNRASRGLEIVRRFRSGEEIGLIRRSVVGEDSFTFDIIEFSTQLVSAIQNGKR